MERRNIRKYKETNTDNSSPIFYFYLFTFGSIGLLTVILYMFGIDFGFWRWGGTVTLGTALWIFVGTLIIEYFVDVWYALNLYKKSGTPKIYAYIPLINSFKVWGRVSQILSVVFISIIAVSLILMISPIVSYVAPTYIMDVGFWTANAIIVSMIGIFIVRGYEMASLKIKLIGRYTALVGQGAAPALGIFKSILYFIPVIRVVLLIEDKTFINNVFATIEQDSKVEKGVL